MIYKTPFLIVGGGLMGMVAAQLFSQVLQTDIMVLDRRALRQKVIMKKGRTLALNHLSQAVLDKVGLWQTLPPQARPAYQKMQVVDAQGFGSIDFEAQAIAAPNLGYILENTLLEQALKNRVRENPRIQWVQAEINSIERQLDASGKPYWHCYTDKNGIIETPFIVGADGANSGVRTALKIPLEQDCPNQTAVVALLNTGLSHEYTAYQRFLPEGPLALLPLADTRQVALVWTCSNQRAKTFLASSVSVQNQQITQASDRYLAELSLSSQPEAYPLKSQQAKTYTQAGLALIGDAAHVLHPLAGQGANLGFADVLSLCLTLRLAKQRGQAITAPWVLRPYERQRRTEAKEMLWLTNGLNRLFSTSNTGLVTLRSLGLSAVNHQAWLKKALMRRALGQGALLDQLSILPSC